MFYVPLRFSNFGGTAICDISCFIVSLSERLFWRWGRGVISCVRCVLVKYFWILLWWVLVWDFGVWSSINSSCAWFHLQKKHLAPLARFCLFMQSFPKNQLRTILFCLLCNMVLNSKANVQPTMPKVPTRISESAVRCWWTAGQSSRGRMSRTRHTRWGFVLRLVPLGRLW